MEDASIQLLGIAKLLYLPAVLVHSIIGVNGSYLPCQLDVLGKADYSLG